MIFKSKLPSETDFGHLGDDLDSDNEDVDCNINEKNKGIFVTLNGDAHHKLCQSWGNALIVKLMGASHAYGYLMNCLTQKWEPKGQWQLVDLNNNFYIAKFGCKEDRDYVLTEVPWMIGGQYLVVQKWRPKFSSNEEAIKKIAVWLRIVDLPVEFMEEKLLRKIGTYIGMVLKVDAIIRKQTKCRFARICVQIRLDEPLQTFVQVDDQWFNLEYEGLNLICFHCGKFGHSKDSCPYIVTNNQ